MAATRLGLCSFAAVGLLVVICLLAWAGGESTSAHLATVGERGIVQRVVEKVTDQDNQYEGLEKQEHRAREEAREESTQEREKSEELGELQHKEIAQTEESERQQEREWH